jgi:uncharacterized protein DUF4124
MKLIFAVMVVAASFSTAGATTFEWVDRAGVVHFTDDLEKVPVDYRSKAVRRESSDEERVSTVPEDKSPAAGTTTEQNREVILYGNHEETWWQNRYATLDKELSQLRDGVPAKRDELARLRRRWVISMGKTPTDNLDAPGSFSTQSALSTPGRHRAAYFAKKAEIESDEARIADLESQLQKLKDEANRFGVPVPWRR